MAGTAKAFGLPIEYVLYEMSYANLILYGASLPTYSSKKDKNKSRSQDEEIIKADDPRNNDRVQAFLDAVD